MTARPVNPESREGGQYTERLPGARDGGGLSRPVKGFTNSNTVKIFYSVVMKKIKAQYF